MIAVGDEAPNFDLTSTEDAVLMLMDEVPRTAVVLYFFSDPASEASRRDLLALGRSLARWKEITASVLAVSPAKLDELKSVQRELKLPYPLLTDDRGFARYYGVVAPEEGEAPPALFVIDRRQRVLWLANPVASVEDALDEVTGALRKLPSPTANIPRKATNLLIDRWVNQKTGWRKKRA